MTRRGEHRIPATRFHDSLWGRRARRICSRDLSWNLGGGCTRARILWGYRRSTSARLYDSLHRERGRRRRERLHVEKKANARKRETSSRLSRKGSNLVANRRKMFETGIGPRTSDEIPSGNIVPFPPFYLNDPCTEGKEREGVFDHRNRSSPRAYFFSFFFLFFEYNSKYGSISNFKSRSKIRTNYSLARDTWNLYPAPCYESKRGEPRFSKRNIFFCIRASCVLRAPICITYMRIEGKRTRVIRMNKTVEYRCWISAKRKGNIKGTEGKGEEEEKKRIFQKLSRHVRDTRVRSNGQKERKKKSEPPLTIGRVFRARNKKKREGREVEKGRKIRHAVGNSSMEGLIG